MANPEQQPVSGSTERARNDAIATFIGTFPYKIITIVRKEDEKWFIFYDPTRT